MKQALICESLPGEAVEELAEAINGTERFEAEVIDGSSIVVTNQDDTDIDDDNEGVS